MFRPRFEFAVLVWLAVSVWLFSSRQAALQNVAASAKSGVTIVFRKDDGFLFHAKEKCSDPSGGKLQECFSRELKQASASAEAVAFSQQLGEPGFASGFREAAPVSVAYVTYPYRANENEAWLLINGQPDNIDVDNQKLLDMGAMRANRAYIATVRDKADLTVWPGDRSSTDFPDIEYAKGSEKVVVAYRLRRGCHACEVVGTAWYAFEFDGTGKFLKTSLAGLTVAEKKAEVIRDSKRVINRSMGGEFSVGLPSPSSGSTWELVKPSPAHVRGIEQLHKDGAEVWRFGALRPGASSIKFKQVSSPAVPGGTTVTFRIMVRPASR